jgi:hypothetical protein
MFTFLIVFFGGRGDYLEGSLEARGVPAGVPVVEQGGLGRPSLERSSLMLFQLSTELALDPQLRF